MGNKEKTEEAQLQFRPNKSDGMTPEGNLSQDASMRNCSKAASSEEEKNRFRLGNMFAVLLKQTIMRQADKEYAEGLRG